MHGEDLRVRRNAEQFALRGDGANHACAVRVRRIGVADRVVFFGDRACEIGMLVVDLGVDNRNQDLFAGRNLVDLGKPQLVDDILVGGAGLRGGTGSGFGRAVLAEHEDVVRRCDADVLRLHRANGGSDLDAGRHLADVEGAAGDAAGLFGDDDHAVPRRRSLH